MEFSQNKLFTNISSDEYLFLRECLSTTEKSFLAGETICTFGIGSPCVGILASGHASIIRYEINGGRTILEYLHPNDIFGENLAFTNLSKETISVICDKDTNVLFINHKHLTTICEKACPCHHQLIRNVLQLISEKMLLFSKRIEVLSKRTIREKLVCFFLQEASKYGSCDFPLSFSMVTLADYLAVDRSAMTRELKKMKEEDLLHISNKFVHLSKENLFKDLSMV